MFISGKEAKTIVRTVVNEVFNAVTATMGPDGRLAIISNGTATKTTKDGVTVARSAQFDDDAHEYVNRVLTEPAIKTDIECGDGTTTTIFLTKYLFELFNKYPSFYEHRIIESIGEKIIEELGKQAIRIDIKKHKKLLTALAMTSANSDKEIANGIVEAYCSSTTGYPEIELAEGHSSVDVFEKANGLPLGCYFSNSGFSGNGTGERTTFKNVYPIIVDNSLRGFTTDDAAALNRVNATVPNGGVIVIIARNIEQDFCAAMSQLNAASGYKRFICLQANAGGGVGTLILGDMATVLGCTLLTRLTDAPDYPCELYTEEMVVGMERTLMKNISDKTRERIAERIKGIEQVLGEMSGTNRHNFTAKFNEKRARTLRGELITIYVGGDTQSDVKERLDRFEDVNKAVKSALENGILPGIGHALRKVSAKVLAMKMEDGVANDIKADMYRFCHRQYIALMCSSMDKGQLERYEELVWNLKQEEAMKEFGYFNLATGKTSDDPRKLNVYDTAYASITAMRGGMKTAKILATTESILLGNKLSAVKFQTR